MPEVIRGLGIVCRGPSQPFASCMASGRGVVMAVSVDAIGLAQFAQTVGLLTEAQIREAWEVLGGRGGDPEPFLQVLERKGYLTPWQSSKLRKGEKTGYFLGGFRLLYKIASGTFGRVFRGDDQMNGRSVAIKVLRKRWSEKKHIVELFEREGRVGLNLKDPGIVEVLSVGHDEASKQHYIVMEFVEGGNLRDFLNIRKKLAPAEALRLMEEITSGLCHASSQGISHRDIKLTNILISTQGEAKLVDFGLAKLYSHLAELGQDNEKIDRTVDYAGLEEATGVQPGDIRTDIFFLGCVLCEMMTGRPPLPPTRDKNERKRRQRYDGIVPLNPHEVAGPPSLFRLVETMMAFDPQQRYQTPVQLLKAIREVRADLENNVEGKTKTTIRSLFIVEKDERLQDALRDKFKGKGYRVLISADPARAFERFQQHPYDSLIVDVGTTGKEGQIIFDRILFEAERRRVNCTGVLLLSEDQADWAVHTKKRPNSAVLVRPVTFKQLCLRLEQLTPANETAATA